MNYIFQPCRNATPIKRPVEQAVEMTAVYVRRKKDAKLEAAFAEGE